MGCTLIVGCQAPCLRKQHNSLVASTKNLQVGLSRGREKSLNVPRGFTSFLSDVSHSQAALCPPLLSPCNGPVWVTSPIHLHKYLCTYKLPLSGQMGWWWWWWWWWWGSSWKGDYCMVTLLYTASNCGDN